MAIPDLSGLIRMLPGQPIQPAPFDVSKKQMNYLKKQIQLTKEGLKDNRLIHTQWNYDQNDYEFTLRDRTSNLFVRIIRAFTRMSSDCLLQHTIWQQAKNIEAILNNTDIPLKEREAFRKSVAAPIEKLIQISNVKLSGIYQFSNLKFETHEINNLYNEFKDTPDSLIYKSNRMPLDISLHGNDYITIEVPRYDSFAQAIITLKRDSLNLNPKDLVELTLYNANNLDKPLLTKSAKVENDDVQLLIHNLPGNEDLIARVSVKRNAQSLFSHDIPCRANYRYNHLELSPNPDQCKFKKLPIPIVQHPEFTESQENFNSLSPKSKLMKLKYDSKSKKCPVEISKKGKGKASIAFENKSKDFCSIHAQVDLLTESKVLKPQRTFGIQAEVAAPKSTASIHATDLIQGFYKDLKPNAESEKALRYKAVYMNVFSSRLRST